jgi:RimJ/RimL family protein N-acetyltransferase
MRDRQPTLAHPAVQLRPATTHDWPALFAAASDPGIWAGHPAHDRWQEPTFRAFFEQGLASGGMLVAIEPGSDAIIGSSRYDLGRVAADEVEVGWTFLVRRHWGGTTNHAMKALMVGYALQQVERVVFVIGENNIRSRTAIARIGAAPSDRQLTVQLSTGPSNHLFFAIDRANFGTGPLATLWAQRLR